MGVKLAKMEALQRDNLLLNADYRYGIVNQKGQSVYENDGWVRKYGVCSWFNIHSITNVSFIEQGYLTIAVNSGEGYFGQIFNKVLPAGEYAFTISVKNINKGSLTVYLEQAMPVKEVTISSIGLHTFIFKPTNKPIGLSIKLNNFSGDIQFMKLEPGTEFTGMPQWNGALETAKCKEFFQMVDFQETIWSDMYENEFTKRILLPVSMRRKPSLTYTIFDNYNVISQKAIIENASSFFVFFKLSSQAGIGHRVGIQVTLDAYDY